MKLFSLGDYGDDVPDRVYIGVELTRCPTMGAYLVGVGWHRYDDRFQIDAHLPFVHLCALFTKLRRAARGRWDDWKPLLHWRRERHLPDRRVTWSAMLDLSDWIVGATWYRDDICTQVNVHPLPFVALLFEQVKREASR